MLESTTPYTSVGADAQRRRSAAGPTVPTRWPKGWNPPPLTHSLFFSLPFALSPPCLPSQPPCRRVGTDSRGHKYPFFLTTAATTTTTTLSSLSFAPLRLVERVDSVSFSFLLSNQRKLYTTSLFASPPCLLRPSLPLALVYYRHIGRLFHPPCSSSNTRVSVCIHGLSPLLRSVARAS